MTFGLKKLHHKFFKYILRISSTKCYGHELAEIMTMTNDFLFIHFFFFIIHNIFFIIDIIGDRDAILLNIFTRHMNKTD